LLWRDLASIDEFRAKDFQAAVSKAPELEWIVQGVGFGRRSSAFLSSGDVRATAKRIASC
jgi:hypothetical protein